MNGHRFVNEYAAYKIKIISALKDARPDSAEEMDERIKLIRNTVLAYERGLITTDEAMMEIADV